MCHDLDQSPAFRPVAPLQRGARVVVGLSGGVDSTVCAFLLKEAGCEVIAVTTRNFCLGTEPFDAASAPRSCCSEEAIESARDLAADLGVQHAVLDVADHFTSTVIDDYVEEYRAGHTPSPCVRCNTHVRFPRLLELATRLDAPFVATGHYARLVERDGARWIARGADRNKDQSYFLYRLPPTLLARMTLPLGERTKDEVRDLARQHGLPVAETPDSQELCFVPDGDRSRLLGSDAMSGEIVDRSGKVLGQHPGVEFFTPGQRRGLDLGGGPARYVVALDAAARRVIVGEEADLLRDRLHLVEALDRDPLEGAPGLVAQTRYRHRGVEVRSLEHRDAEWIVDLAEPDRAPAPGQTAVLYRDDVAVGGGRLVRAERIVSEENS